MEVENKEFFYLV